MRLLGAGDDGLNFWRTERFLIWVINFSLKWVTSCCSLVLPIRSSVFRREKGIIKFESERCRWCNGEHARIVVDRVCLSIEHAAWATTAWLGIRRMCPYGATCLTVDSCFSELTLCHSNESCWYYYHHLIAWLTDWFIVINATFSNMSAISWWAVVVVEEETVPVEINQSWGSNRQTA